MELTTWGYMDGDIEILDFQVHKETDKGRGINMMIKKSGYFLSRIVPYLLKNLNKKIILINYSIEEYFLLKYILSPYFDQYENNIIFNHVWGSPVSRSKLEQILINSPSLINTLWTLDYKGLTPKNLEENIPLTNNISYSRPEILEFDKKVYTTFTPKTNKCVIIPCSSGKPYHKRKHNPEKSFAKIQGKNKHTLHEYISNDEYDKIVLTSLGLIPQDFWLDPIVMAYDTGTRDLWKLLCLCKRFFTKYKFDEIIVLVKFKPYRDIIRNLIDMGVIEKNKVTFVGDDEKPNGLRIMFYPNDYKLYD